MHRDNDFGAYFIYNRNVYEVIDGKEQTFSVCFFYGHYVLVENLNISYDCSFYIIYFSA